MGLIEDAKELQNMGIDLRMLEALKASDELLLELYRTIDKDHFYRDQLVNVAMQVREAIAKAEGK